MKRGPLRRRRCSTTCARSCIRFWRRTQRRWSGCRSGADVQGATGEVHGARLVVVQRRCSCGRLHQIDTAAGEVHHDTGIAGKPERRRASGIGDRRYIHVTGGLRVGDEGAARTSLNLVRNRVGIPEITATGPALLDAILRERRIELGLEAHRFFDLVRTHRAAQELGPLGFMQGVHELFPIPQSQIEATNGAITQNPGY